MNMLKQAAMLLVVCGVCGSVQAETYRVGSGRTYTEIDDVTGMLNAGDTVLVDGNDTYAPGAYVSRDGAPGNPIVIIGLAPRPVLTGSANYGIEISGSHIVLQGFEVDGMPKGIGVFGDDITVRDCYVTDCNMGLIGYGTGTGDVTVEYCEFYGNGVPTGGATCHQIYMATDEESHPGATFRLQYCYLHDGVEGDNVKSRSERNEIYYNWIENSGYSGHGLGLFAPDPEDNPNVNISTAREDADVVGNVIINDHNACARIGGDWVDYPTNGRYRFVNNTFVLTGTGRADVIRTFEVVETLEMYNNVIYRAGSGNNVRVLNDADGDWVHNPRSVLGANNWVVDGAGWVPASDEWDNTLRGSTSPFVDASAQDYRPDTLAQLFNAGVEATPTMEPYDFVDPLWPPAFHPPVQELIGIGTEEARVANGTIDIGALEAQTESAVRCPPAVRGWAASRDRSDFIGQAMYSVSGREVTGRGPGRTGVFIARRTGSGVAVRSLVVE